MKTLTKAEEQIMQQLWMLEAAFLRELVDSFPEPKPVYATVSSMIRILIEKEFVGFKQFGSNRQYYPLVGREEYVKGQFKGVLSNYFQGSFTQFASFYTDDGMSLEELEEVNKLIAEKIKNRKS